MVGTWSRSEHVRWLPTARRSNVRQNLWYTSLSSLRMQHVPSSSILGERMVPLIFNMFPPFPHVDVGGCVAATPRGISMDCQCMPVGGCVAAAPHCECMQGETVVFYPTLNVSSTPSIELTSSNPRMRATTARHNIRTLGCVQQQKMPRISDNEITGTLVPPG